MNDKPRMTIIGYGRMGQRFAGEFADGFDVLVCSRRDVSAELKTMGVAFTSDVPAGVVRAEFILLAVPIHALDEVIELVNESVDASAWAFDMCSARVAAGKKMSALKCRWFGLHAGGLFGEGPEQIVSYLVARGHSCSPMAAEEHDRQNARVGMVHFIGLVLDSLLNEEDREALRHSPAARNLLHLVEHLRANAPVTYCETQIFNPFAQRQRQRLIEAMTACDEELQRGRFGFAPDLSVPEGPA